MQVTHVLILGIMSVSLIVIPTYQEASLATVRNEKREGTKRLHMERVGSHRNVTEDEVKFHVFEVIYAEKRPAEVAFAQQTAGFCRRQSQDP